MNNSKKNNQLALSKEQVDHVMELYSSGKINDAIDAIKALNKDFPNVPLLFNILGACYKSLGQLDASIRMFQTAVDIKPDYAEVYNNLGITQMQLKQLNAAVESFNKALVIIPNYAEAYNNLGNAFKELRQFTVAIKNYQKAISIKPELAEGHNNLGLTFLSLGHIKKSAECFERAIAIKPDFASAHNNLGSSFRESGNLKNAVKCHENAIAINPNFAEAHNNLGNALKDLKHRKEALLCYEKAFDINPDIDFILGNILNTKLHLCIWDDLLIQIDVLINKINNNEKVIAPFPLIGLVDNLELHRKATKVYLQDKYPKKYELSEIELYPKHKKIRIGYFSADFRDHPVSHLTAQLYELHDREKFEIYAFSYGPDTKDEMNLRIKSGVDHFYDVQSLSHQEVVILARSLEIDIAVDLGGFTKKARTEIFAMQAAPIQINYLGYPASMGLSFIDYIIADKTVIPEDKQDYYSEKIVYLPDSFMVIDNQSKISTKNFKRDELGLPEQGFIFCSFNNHYKITPSVFCSWMRILSMIDGSILWLAEANSTTISNLRKEAEKNGVDGNRLIFATRLPLKEDHLNRIRVADLFLDTLPYNAHTTCSDALKMGLPVITCIGDSYASRVAASLLNAVDLPELITNSSQEYESLAIDLAQNKDKLNVIKDKLVSNLTSTPLNDTSLFTKNLEKAYLEIYKRHQLKIEPEHIFID